MTVRRGRMDALGPFRATQQPDPARVCGLVQDGTQARGADGLAGSLDAVVVVHPAQEGAGAIEHAHVGPCGARQQEAHPSLDEESAGGGDG